MAWSVLVVDDEPMTRTLLQLMLASADYEVIEAGDGQEALALIEQEVPHILILDVMMPHIDGLTVCRRLRQNEATKQLPIILLSAKTSPEAVREGLIAGADRYLTKPVSRKDLLENLEALRASLSIGS